MSLSFEFPGFHKQWTGSVQHDDVNETSIDSKDGWQHDLEELSGDEGEQQQDEDHTADQQQHVPSDKQQRTSGASDGSQYVPDAVLLLVVDKLALRDVMALACCCRSFHESLLINSSAMWVQQEKQLLGETAGSFRFWEGFSSSQSSNCMQDGMRECKLLVTGHVLMWRWSC
jgi:hypothetical protein